MTSLQEKKLKMYLVLRVLLRSEPAILAKLPNGEEYLKALDDVIQSIMSITQLKNEGTGKIKEQQNQLSTQFKERLLEDAGKLKPYANYKDNKPLIAFCTLSDTKLSKMKEIDVIVYAKSLYGYINESFTELTKYQLTADTQASLLDKISNFEVINPQLSTEKGKYKNLSGDLNDDYKQADAIIAKLDDEVELIRNSDTEMYRLYWVKRKVEYHANSNQLTGHVMDAETGAGIPNATLSFALTGSSSEPLVKQTADKGGFQLKTITPGIYTVTVSKLGYVTQTLTITLTGDEPYSLDVKMVKG